jgi:hypothetical protein
MSTAAAQPVDQTKLHDFIMKAVGEMGAAMNAALILVGDKSGLYKAMAGSGPLTSAEIASKTGTHERYVREWLAAQAAGGFIIYDPATSRYNLPAEQAMALADESSPVFLPGFFEVIEACIKDVPKITEAFKTGKGVGWHEHEGCLFHGDGAVLPSKLPRSFSERMDSRAWRCGSKIEIRRNRRGCGMWVRNFDDPDGAGLSEIEVCGIRLSCAFD